MAFRTMSGQSFTLGSSISSTQTTILLTSFKVPVSGTDITMATMGTSVAYGTLAPGTSSAELISFTGVTQNADGTATLTGVTRGLDKEYPYAEDSNFKQPHAGQTIFILSDAPQVFNQYPAKQNDETITGQFTFPQSGTASAARAGAVYAAPTQDTELATKKYVDDTASFGAPLATTTTAGIVEIPTATQLETGTLLGETGAGLVVLNAQYGARKILGYNVTGGTPNAYTVDVGSSAPTSYATGQIVGFLASFTNTGNATLNVSGLGAKNLFLGSTGLSAGAISTNSYIGAVYDGTQFEIVEGSDLISASATANTLPLRRSTGDITVPSTPTASTDAASKGYVDTIGTKIAVTTTDVTYSSSTSENTLTTTSIAGGILSTGNAVRVTMHVSALGTFSTATATIRFKYGGTTLTTHTLGGVSASTFSGKMEFLLAGAGTTSSQNGSSSINLGTNGYVGNGNLQPQYFASSLQGTSSIDSTTAQNLVITYQASNNSASDNITVSMIVVEKIIA